MTPFEASKWLKVQVLLSPEEMRTLFLELGNFHICKIGSVVKDGEEIISHQSFLESYASYVKELQEGKAPNDADYRAVFCSALTTDPQQDFFKVKVGEDQTIVRIIRPVIQQLLHRMDYSFDDGKFRSMVMGTDTISWGIQYAFPQIFLDPKSQEVKKVLNNPLFPNGELFQRLQRWVRHHTNPIPFMIKGKKVVSSIRLGKECFGWINNHPQLKKRELFVLEDRRQ